MSNTRCYFFSTGCYRWVLADFAFKEAEEPANITANHLKAHDHNLDFGPSAHSKFRCTLGALGSGDGAFSSGALAGSLAAQGFAKYIFSGLGRQNGFFRHAQYSALLLEFDRACVLARTAPAVFGRKMGIDYIFFEVAFQRRVAFRTRVDLKVFIDLKIR